MATAHRADAVAALVEAGQRFVENDSWCASLAAHDATQADCACGYVALRAALERVKGESE